MRLPPTRRQRNRERIHALFESIRLNVPQGANSSWLDALERDALRVRPGWRQRFDAFLEGLEQARCVAPIVASQWRRNAGECLSTEVRAEPVVFSVLWSLLVTLATLAWQSMLTTRALVVAGDIAIAATAVTWAWRAGWLTDPGRPRPPLWNQALRAAGVALMGLAIGVIAPGLCADLAKQGTYQAFMRHQQAYAAAPDGFPWLRDFARREYGLDVVLAAPGDAWIRTTLQMVGASPAYMSTGNGMCELSMSRESLLNGFAKAPASSLEMWIKGVEIHELWHCADIARDYTGPGGAWSGRASIAPADRAEVLDGPRHYQTGGRLATQLWREALADMGAIGYWRLHADPATAMALVKTLRDKRVQASAYDKAHATACWIDLAMAAAPPDADRALFGWTDALRASAQCPMRSH